jgi:taurine dioxygenase
MAVEVTALGFAAGAQITGLDLRQPLDAAQREALNGAWLKHIVLVFPDQDLSPTEQMAFSANFGDVDDHASQAPSVLHKDHREILVLTNKLTNNKRSGTYNTGRNWHTDLSYTVRPAKGALLNCKEKPPVGGDTMWANMCLAYDTLSAPIRTLVEGLRAIHDVSLVKGIEGRDPEVVREMKQRNPAVLHPLVRVHPETGRKSLLVGQRIRGFAGVSDEEGAAILAMLNEHAFSAEFVYRHRWSLHDLVMWDNRCSAHVALADFDQTQPRVMHRVSLQGEETTGALYGGEPPSDRSSVLQAIAAVS